MDSHSFVSQEGSGYAVHLAEQRIAWHHDLGTAQQIYVDLLKEKEGLHDIACIRSRELTVSFSHTRPNGLPWDTVFPPAWTGMVMENLATAPSLESAIDGWMKSPPHRANMLEPVDTFGYCNANGYHATLGWQK